jgi:uncharacterized membrane protein
MSAVVVCFGGVGYLAEHGQEPRDHKVFRGEPVELRQPSQIVAAALRFESSAVIQLGLLLLIATPIARVALSVIGFLRERDFTYVALTLVVLGVLLGSLFLGKQL